MRIRTLQASALTLTALGLAPGAAHVLELPVKLGYTPEMYADVTSTLYAWYGIVAGPIQITALVTVALLARRTRGRSRGLVAASAAALLASLLLWAFVVAPVNATWGAALESTDAVAAYARLRSRWEFGHVAAFVAWLAGWFGLVAAVTRGTDGIEIVRL